MNKVLPSLDKLFSFFVFLVIVMLAFYMALRIGVAGNYMLQGVLSGELLDHDILDEFSRRALHSIAEMIILIKAYRILVSYVKTHHVSVEYIVEISIIAPAIELLFAAEYYDTPSKIILAVFGLANLFLYLHFFGPEHDEELHKGMKGGHKH
jgi:uncharacterized membrane protein (DUF373 family)